jgi:hypothetical protein
MTTRRACQRLALVMGIVLLAALGGWARAEAQVAAGDYIVTPAKPHFAPGENIVVNWSAFGGHAQDWVSVVSGGSPENKYVSGYWRYTQGERRGTAQFGPLAPGRYEVRAYCCWSEGGYEVRGRATFDVVAGGAKPPPGDPVTQAPPPAAAATFQVRTLQSSYAAGQKIYIRFSDFEGSGSDWITIVPVGKPDTWRDERYWMYTGSRHEGTVSFDGLPSGRYEVRSFCCWKEGGYKARDRYRFMVR